MAVESHRRANATVAGFRQPGTLGGVLLSYRRHEVCEAKLPLLTLTGQQSCRCIYRRMSWPRQGDLSDEKAVVLTRTVTRVSIFLSEQQPPLKPRSSLRPSATLPSYPPTTQTKNSPSSGSHYYKHRILSQQHRVPKRTFGPNLYKSV